MSSLSKLFHELLDAWAEVKTGIQDHDSGDISHRELFDIEFNAFELEEKFISQLKKIK